MARKKINGLLHKLYYDVNRSSAAFSGPTTLLREARKADRTVSADDVRSFLQRQDVYTLQRAARRRFPRNPIVCDGPGLWLVADLLDVSNLSRWNDRVRFLLCVIDCFSRKGYVRVLLDKSASVVENALRSILDENLGLRSVRYLNTDKGKEFYNRLVQGLLHDRNIHHFTTADYKAFLVERFNRTLRTL